MLEQYRNRDIVSMVNHASRVLVELPWPTSPQQHLHVDWDKTRRLPCRRPCPLSPTSLLQGRVNR